MPGALLRAQAVAVVGALTLASVLPAGALAFDHHRDAVESTSTRGTTRRISVHPPKSSRMRVVRRMTATRRRSRRCRFRTAQRRPEAPRRRRRRRMGTRARRRRRRRCPRRRPRPRRRLCPRPATHREVPALVGPAPDASVQATPLATAAPVSPQAATGEPPATPASGAPPASGQSTARAAQRHLPLQGVRREAPRHEAPGRRCARTGRRAGEDARSSHVDRTAESGRRTSEGHRRRDDRLRRHRAGRPGAAPRRNVVAPRASRCGRSPPTCWTDVSSEEIEPVERLACQPRPYQDRGSRPVLPGRDWRSSRHARGRTGFPP